MKYQVLFGAKAKQDVLDLFDFIASQDSPEKALKFLSRVDQWCRSFGTFPERGLLRNDVRPGLRVAGFRRRVSIGFEIAGDRVVILRLLYGGRNVTTIDFQTDTDPEE